MFTESVPDSSEGLSHILFPTDFASNAVDQVGTSTADVHHRLMRHGSGVACDGACLVK